MEQFKNISPEELNELLKNNSSPFLLDVREPFELMAFGKIPGVHNIPIRKVASRLEELPQEKDATIISICQSGSRSMNVAEFLAQKGYTNIYNLVGGTSNWVMNGLDVEK